MSVSQRVTKLTDSERSVLRVFRDFLMSPGQMLCFHGPDLKKHQAALEQLTKRNMLVKEEFKGGYSLTRDGFACMKGCA